MPNENSLAPGALLLCPLRRVQPKVRLVCFPHAGGGASTFRRWTGLLSSDIELNAIQLPGRENRVAERACTSFEALVPILAGAVIRQCWPSFAFFGHSLGALVCYEVARYMRQRCGVL